MSERGAEGQLRRRQEAITAQREAAPPASETTAARVPSRTSSSRAQSNATGYWSFVMVAVFVLFIFYVAGKGELQTWINILIPNPAKPPTVSAGGTQPSALGSDAAKSAASAPSEGAVVGKPSGAPEGAAPAWMSQGFGPLTGMSSSIQDWINKNLGLGK
jgi:hypothetical protein